MILRMWKLPNFQAGLLFTGLIILYCFVGIGVTHAIYGDKYPDLLDIMILAWPLFLLLHVIYLLSVPIISIVKWWKRKKAKHIS